MTKTLLRLGLGMLVVLPAACAPREPPPPPMSAAPPSMGMSIARACGADIDRLCPGVPPGDGRIKACMKANISQVSPGCFDTLVGAIASEREPQ